MTEYYKLHIKKITFVQDSISDINTHSRFEYNNRNMSEITVFLRHAKRSHSTDLDLSMRQLSFVPKQLFSMRNVERLNLSNNKLEYIEASITELYKLKELDLSNNLLTEIPSEIAAIPLLSVLKLDGNPLSPQFQHLLNPHNASGPNLIEALRQCFQSETRSKTPQWLIEPNNSKEMFQKQTDIMWDEKIFKVEKKPSRRADQRAPQEKQPQSIFKNGVLEIKNSDLMIGEQISMGGFSTIHKGKFSGLEVAVKKVFNPNISEELMTEFNNQIAMLSKYRHPNIVLLIGAVTIPPTLAIVMEYCRQGTLYDLLHKKKTPLLEQNKTQITRQILLALSFLHKMGIVHRDIKSHNILINGQMQVKLCDFGLARHRSDLNTGPMQFSGTPTYMAPELFLKKSYDENVDIFALGTMFYELYTGEIPYYGLDPADIQKKVVKDGNLPQKIGMKKSICEIINRCRASEPGERPSMTELLDFEQW